VLGIEVKSGARPGIVRGMVAFQKAYPTARTLVVGEGGVPLPEFLSKTPADWFA
jgi:uncharacterized protein